MRRLTFVLALSFMFLLPLPAYAGTVSSPEPWDYTAGLLDDEDIVLTTNMPQAWYDNDTSTSDLMLRGSSTQYFIDFKRPVNISGYYVNTSTSWPGHVYLLIYFLGEEETENVTVQKGGYQEVTYENVIRIEMAKTSNYTFYVNEVDFFGSYEVEDVTPPGEVTGLKAEAGDGEVVLRWTSPSDEDFSHVRIYLGEQRIADAIKSTTYKITGLQNGKKYTFRVVTVDTSGNESSGVTVEAVPQEASKEVSNLRATARYDRVDLSWQNPKRSDFKLVRIYRKEIDGTAVSIIPVAHAEEYKAIFETNGTFFRDMTVEPEHSYEYKLTTITNGQESAGVTVQVTTPPIPPPSTGGTTVIRHENGDVTVRWTPQPGQMLIEIDGVEYRRVDAQLGEYTIPASDIPVDEHGKPAPIRLIPIAPNGDTGKPIVINPGGWIFSLPFGAFDLLQAGVDLLVVFGPIILLSLAILYVRPIMRLLREAARGRART